MIPEIFPRGCIVTFPNRQFWICFLALLIFESCEYYSIPLSTHYWDSICSSDHKSLTYESFEIQYGLLSLNFCNPERPEISVGRFSAPTLLGMMIKDGKYSYVSHTIYFYWLRLWKGMLYYVFVLGTCSLIVPSAPDESHMSTLRL